MAVDGARQPLASTAISKLGRRLAYLQALQAALAVTAFILGWPADWIDANARWLGLVAPWYVFGVYWDAAWPLIERVAAIIGAFLAIPVGLWISALRPSQVGSSARPIAMVASAGLAAAIQAFAYVTPCGS